MAVPFLVRVKTEHNNCNYLGVINYRKSRGGRNYACVNIGQGNDHHVYEDECPQYADYYKYGLLAVLSHMDVNILNNNDCFAEAVKANPTEFPSFFVKQYGYSWVSLEYNKETVTEEEVNKLLATAGGEFRVW